MKKCPYCAEEIQDAAIVCKHCGRDLAQATPSPPSVDALPARKSKKGAVVLIGALGLVLLAAIFMPRSPRSPSEVTLEVTAARGSGGFQLTNRESSPISKCEVTLLDVGAAEWVATAPGPLAPLQSVFVPWNRFQSAGQTMPASIGQNRPRFLVSCFVDSIEMRRSAGLSF